MDTTVKSKKQLLGQICKDHKFVLGLYYIVAGTTLLGIDHWTTDATLEIFVFDSKKYPVKMGSGMRGTVWNTGMHLWHENVQKLDEVQFARKKLAIKSGLQACLSIAVKEEGKVIGVMELFLREAKKEDPLIVMKIKEKVQN